MLTDSECPCVTVGLDEPMFVDVMENESDSASLDDNEIS